MDIAIIIVFMLLGIAFFVLELFFLPGISVGGVAGTIFVGLSVWYSFTHLGHTVGYITLLLGAITFAVAVWLFIKSKTLEKISLNTQLEDGDKPFDTAKIHVGDRGISLTRMAPMGTVLINGEELEAKSIDGFIDNNIEIEVIDISGISISVRKIDN